MFEKAATVASAAQDTGFALAHPLEEFYKISGQTMPPLSQVEGSKVPEPYKSLLVHQNDMTPTLEKFYQRTIHLKVVGRRQTDGAYFREVVLLLDGTDQPIEFGAIKINLGLFPEKAREEILQERLPLGRILHEHKIPHASRPRAFIKVASDRLINGLFNASGAQVLYGRRNTLFDPKNRPLAEIVEILPAANQ